MYEEYTELLLFGISLFDTETPQAVNDNNIITDISNTVSFFIIIPRFHFLHNFLSLTQLYIGNMLKSRKNPIILAKTGAYYEDL